MEKKMWSEYFRFTSVKLFNLGYAFFIIEHFYSDICSCFSTKSLWLFG